MPTSTSPGVDLTGNVGTDDGGLIEAGHAGKLTLNLDPVTSRASTPVDLSGGSNTPNSTVFTNAQLLAGTVNFVPTLASPVPDLSNTIATPDVLGTTDGDASEGTRKSLPTKTSPTEDVVCLVDTEYRTVSSGADVTCFAFDSVPPIAVKSPNLSSSVQAPNVSSSNGDLGQGAIDSNPINLHGLFNSEYETRDDT
eukprot:TRINITY_DN14542_c0_g1_i1.p2 TRINITY_DN14542_c0_g1~~TRINITY_DN14542_c0_g1_i1.p2  ORF type:complete len:196 (+),score=29.77 TRINITY_DN14542_c0_g1_i1:133-720(+)